MRRFLAALLCAWMLFLSVLSAAGGEESLVFRRGEDNGKIALSFDDGPHPEYTPEILEILAEYGIKATFFVIGENAAAHPDVVKKVFEEGHEIANHTYTHTFLNRMSLAKMCLEVTKASDTLEQITGERPKLFRPPGGAYNDQKVAALRDMGYTCVLWSKDTRDWSRPSVEAVVTSALSTACGGDIILFHDFNLKGSPTPEALRRIIPELLARGFELCCVSEVLGL